MNIEAFADLFKNYCENFLYKKSEEDPGKPLHFIYYDMEDVFNDIRSMSFPAFFLSTPEDDFGGENADSIHESYEASFMVLLPLPNNNIKRKGEIISIAKNICDQFIRRMMYDSKTTSVIDGLNIPGIKAGIVSRTVDSLYGWTVSFNIIQGFNGQIDRSVWEDLPG